ncbi:hypothetical protein Tco_0760166, partial [Tanacetum coccineum]
NSLVPFVNLTTPSDGSCVILDISTKGFSSTTCDSLRVKFSSHDLIVQNLSHDVQRGVKIYVGYFYMHMSNVAWYLKGTKPSDSKNELSLQTFSVTNELDGSGGKEWLVLMFSELSFSSCSSSSSLLFWNCGFGLSIEGLLLGKNEQKKLERIVVEGKAREQTVRLKLVSPRLFWSGLKVNHLPPASSLTTGRLINGSSCGAIDIVIKDLDLDLKIDAMMWEFLELGMLEQNLTEVYEVERKQESRIDDDDVLGVLSLDSRSNVKKVRPWSKAHGLID